MAGARRPGGGREGPREAQHSREVSALVSALSLSLSASGNRERERNESLAMLAETELTTPSVLKWLCPFSTPPVAMRRG